MDKIDIVLTWVDGNDENWKKQREQYTEKSDGNVNCRFRDWETLRYVFRGIEEFMPWVNKVFFVTWGHLPAWLNTNNSKLVIVKHEDYIPARYLPTFNSNVLDVNMFRIKGLSEQYINFNDDTIPIKQTSPEDFFLHGKPKDLACISPQPIRRDSITNVEVNNLQILNTYFSTKDVKKNWRKWLDIKKYGTYAIRTLLFLQFQTIVGVFEPHIPNSHLKSVAAELWDKETEAYETTCMHKFRTKLDINDWLSRQWQMLSGNFEPRSRKFGKFMRVTETEAIHKTLSNSPYKIVCINDNLQEEERFEELKKYILRELNNIMPQPSSYELDI